MRWFQKWATVGETRGRRRFLLFPKTIDMETRWLEWADFWQKCAGNKNGKIVWVDDKWV